MNPFDFINSVTFNKENLMDEKCEEKDYNPFIVNRGLSYFADTVHYANMMNQHHRLDKRMQYEFLLNIISKKKRYAKWHKEQNNENIEAICQFYTVSPKRAEEYLSILTDQQLDIIKQRLSKGGKTNERKGK